MADPIELEEMVVREMTNYPGVSVEARLGYSIREILTCINTALEGYFTQQDMDYTKINPDQKPQVKEDIKARAKGHGRNVVVNIRRYDDRYVAPRALYPNLDSPSAWSKGGEACKFGVYFNVYPDDSKGTDDSKSYAERDRFMEYARGFEGRPLRFPIMFTRPSESEADAEQRHKKGVEAAMARYHERTADHLHSKNGSDHGLADAGPSAPEQMKLFKE